MPHTNNPSTLGPVAEGFLEVQGQFGPHSEFQVSIGYRVRSCQERMCQMLGVGGGVWGGEETEGEKGVAESWRDQPKDTLKIPKCVKEG